MVALETRFGNFIAVFAAAKLHHLKTIANFHALHRINAHQRVRNVRIEAVKYRLTEPRRNAIGHHGYFRSDGVALFFQASHQFIERFNFLWIRTEERVLFNLFPIFDSQRNIPHLGQAAANHNPEFRGEEFLGNRSGSHAHSGFTGRGTTAAAIVAQAIFLFVGVVSVARAENVFNRAVILRTLIGILNQQTNAGPGSHPLEYAGEDFNLVRFAALGSIARCSRTSAIEIVLQIGFG